MPKKEPKGASTPRVKRLRARRRLRKLISEHDGMFALDLTAYCLNQGLAPGTWVSATDFASGYLPETQQAILDHELSGIESTTATIEGKLLRLIRPKL